MKFFVGIDAGASNLRLRVENGEGQLVGEAWGRPSSLTMGADRAAANIRDALSHALLGSNITIDQCVIGCGVAGGRQLTLRERVRSLLADAGGIKLVTDGYTALLGAHAGRPGAIVVVGTGTVGVGLDRNGHVRQVGGWGPLGGDEGSGCWIGREAVRATLRAMDEGLPPEGPDRAFFCEIRYSLGSDHNPVLDWLRQASSTMLAALAPVVLDHAAAGSPTAGAIVDKAVAEIGRLARLASNNGDLPVAMTGGLALALAPRLPADISSWLVEPQADAVAGALKVARGEAEPEYFLEAA